MIGCAVFDPVPLYTSSPSSKNDLFDNLRLQDPELSAYNTIFMRLFHVCSEFEEDTDRAFKAAVESLISDNNDITHIAYYQSDYEQ